MRDELKQLANLALELNKQPESKQIGTLLWQLLVSVDIVLEFTTTAYPDKSLATVKKKLRLYQKECDNPNRTSRKKNTQNYKIWVLAKYQQ